MATTVILVNEVWSSKSLLQGHVEFHFLYLIYAL